MLLPSSPPPSTLSAFVGLLKFVVDRLLSYWDPRNINKNGEFMGITFLLLEEKMIGLKLEDGQRFDHLQALANTNLEPPLLILNSIYVVGQKRFLLGTDLKSASTTTQLMNSDDITQFVMVVTTTASSNKTPDVDSQSILPAVTVSYTVHVPRRAEEVDEAMSSFENEEKRHVSDCFKSIKPSSPLSLCVNEITIFLHGIDIKQCNKETN
ncbi:hypothetical protein HID58_058052 [Brassica napus]|uniref:Uncharacterized protein n=1 Tax=Brassica napus TaxID=3708 RepID=A0ABQ7ZNX8_BRANA|nr:hypothetical protein HID58_058052 [Brassica napus]